MVAVIAPDSASLLGFVSVVAPAIVTGNTVVALASERYPLPAVSLTEVLATSDVPGGAVNVLTGRNHRRDRPLAGLAHGRQRHRPDGRAPPIWPTTSAVAAAENLKRVFRPRDPDQDWIQSPGLDRMLAYLETCKTVWHPAGT